MVNRVKKMGRVIGAIKSGARELLGKDLSRAVSGRAVDAVQSSGYLTPMKMGSKGAIKKKTVPALLHKGEVVLTATQVKALKKILK